MQDSCLMKPSFTPLGLLLGALVLSPLAWAEKADRAKPMAIEADALRHDELRQTSVFTGRVVMTKGSIVLRGARLEVKQDASGYQSGTVTSEPGQRAFFRQKRDTPPGAPEEFIEGESETIEYDGRNDNVKFTTRAELRRLRGGAVADELFGASIIYHNLTDVFTVDGQRKSERGSPVPGGGRVRAVLSPKESAPATDPAPAKTGPALRPSSQIGGKAP